MKRCFVALTFFWCALGSSLHAGSDSLAAVKRADANRVEATISGDATRLGQLLADDLIYCHSDGRLQTKAEFIAAVVNNQIKYEALDYTESQIREIAPGVATMNGRVRLKVSRGETRVEFTLRFLAVWREEGGSWRLCAYQSTRLPEAPATKSP